MSIRQVNVSESDKRSAQIFFDALFNVYDLKEARVLDAFARNGQLTVGSYAKYLESTNQLTCWEMQQEHYQWLRNFTQHVSIGDSYQLLKKAINTNYKYDLVVIDTPQGLHKDSNGNVHAEHFDFFKQSLQLIADSAVVVLYVNKSPYDKGLVGSHGYDEYSEYDFDRWMEYRRDFYGVVEGDERGALSAYRSCLNGDFEIKSVLQVPCFSDVPGKESYSFRLALEITR